jgi:hypothetical protein
VEEKYSKVCGQDGDAENTEAHHAKCRALYSDLRYVKSLADIDAKYKDALKLISAPRIEKYFYFILNNWSPTISDKLKPLMFRNDLTFKEFERKVEEAKVDTAWKDANAVVARQWQNENRKKRDELCNGYLGYMCPESMDTWYATKESLHVTHETAHAAMVKMRDLCLQLAIQARDHRIECAKEFGKGLYESGAQVVDAIINLDETVVNIAEVIAHPVDSYEAIKEHIKQFVKEFPDYTDEQYAHLAGRVFGDVALSLVPFGHSAKPQSMKVLGIYNETNSPLLIEAKSVTEADRAKDFISSNRNNVHVKTETIQNERLFRVHGKDNVAGRYFTTEPPASTAEAIQKLALDPSFKNPATHMSILDVPAGIITYRGIVKEQGNLPGGGTQVYVHLTKPEIIDFVKKYTKTTEKLPPE